MRACLLALAAIAIAQPAFARDTAHKSHQIKRPHQAAPAAKHYRPNRKVRRSARLHATPIESGYAMPQSFAPTGAMDSPLQAWTSMTVPAPRARALRPKPQRNGEFDAMIARHAAANGLPVELVHRVVIRESRYNPNARNRGALGLMQIKHATARGVAYTGPASGLFDPETNLTYAVRYLAGAWQAAGGNAGRAVAYYASGYGRGRRAPVVANASRPMQVAPVAMRDTHVADEYVPRTHRSGERDASHPGVSHDRTR